ncbi:MAG: hypothetical protein DWQ18_03100 [Crenarchaeota archaeon]|nr:MAG: hypothetical protein DWQ17_05430 [Thermoproteota archaeon]RDJ33914.1 MAG: hypothetical protein DWQ18_03100 [Thermoproteota archaeon]RDJ36974.1 MAG: hypothetical protein DWQ13_07520 [Thermoproteota archaeon]RDJ37491.1 MAG: hypothetical protein DWQ19_03315 [Thermoproteota archaeon]
MSNDDIEIIGKQVKDMYGTSMGKVIGTITDIDGSIQTVGVDCGSQGLQQIPYEQLVAQGNVVIFIPKWRLDSQRLLREKGLTLRRLKALMEIVSQNDEMKDDAEVIHEKYKAKLFTLGETEHEITAKLEARLAELDEQMKAVKMLVFDAKVQYKSNEISESVFESVKRETTDLIEHITHENAEISNVQRRINDLEMEVQQTLESPKQHLQDSAVSYLDDSSNIESKLPEAPTHEPTTAPSDTPKEAERAPQIPQPPQQVTPITSQPKAPQDDWLARMEAQ